MNIISIVLFLSGVLSAGLLAIGMDPYSCGVPLVLMSLGVLTGKWKYIGQSSSGLMNALVFCVVIYFGIRMLLSPIADFGRSDALLMAGALIAYVWISSRDAGKRLISWIILLWVLVIVNVIIAVIQAHWDINYYPIYTERATKDFPSGLYLHYNHFANFLLGVGLLSLGYGMAGVINRSFRFGCFLIYLICLYGVVLSHSRGALLAISCGTALVLVGWLADLWRQKKSWAGGALVVATVLAPLLVMGAWHVGSKSLSNRGSGDSGRLEFASMAVQLIQEKPLTGGGSRSFFFDSFKKWNVKELWTGGGDAEYVHNEYLQAAVDYGLIGLALLLLLFVVAMFRGMVFVSFARKEQEGDAGLALGAMAALCGMGVQAFFSFVYHVLPDVILMGACLGLLSIQSWSSVKARKGSSDWWKWTKGIAGSSVAVGVIVLAWRDTAAWLVVRPSLNFFRTTPEKTIIRLKKAVAFRPDFRVLSVLSGELLEINRETVVPLAVQKSNVEESAQWQELCLMRCPDSYIDILNLALIYDSLGRLDDAEKLYQRLVGFLDSREMQYGVRFHYSRHLVARGNVLWRARQPERALVLFMRAKNELAKSYYRGDGDERKELQDLIDKTIRFLEGANIKPSAD
jgi:O-antigen ligase